MTSGQSAARPPGITVELPPPLVRLFPGSTARVEVAAATVAEAIDALNRNWPGMRDRLCDATPRLRRHIIIFADGARAGLDTPLRPGATMLVRTAMIG